MNSPLLHRHLAHDTLTHSAPVQSPRTRRTLLASGLALALATLLPAQHATAQSASYPSQALRLYVPYPPGGATDVLGRLAGEAYTQAFGQPVIVENRGGGGTTIGTRALASAEPDGYTLGIIDSTFTINPGLLGERLPYDTLRDFTPITQIATAPFVMVVHPSVPATTLDEFLALARAQPDALSYGSAGIGSAPHLAGEQLAQAADVQLMHVPYRGGSTVFTDLLGGQVQFAFATVPSLLEHIRSGRLRALAVTTPTRVESLPDVPTFTEAGMPSVDIMPLFGLLAPAGTSPEHIQQLASPLDTGIQQGPLGERLRSMGFVPVGQGPEAFGKHLQSEVAKWTEVIERAGIRPE